jgi:hypothetical protein
MIAWSDPYEAMKLSHEPAWDPPGEDC